MSVQTQIQGLIDTLTGSLADAGKHDAGQNAAGGRVRAVLQQVKVACGDARKTIQDERNARKKA